MGEFAATAGQSAAIHHTLQRHTEILQDYRQEFNKTAANIAAIVEREDLLSSVHNDINDYKSKDKAKVNQRMDALLRESEHTRCVRKYSIYNKKMSECQTKAGNQVSHSHSLTVSHSLTLVILNNFCFHV